MALVQIKEKIINTITIRTWILLGIGIFIILMLFFSEDNYKQLGIQTYKNKKSSSLEIYYTYTGEYSETGINEAITSISKDLVESSDLQNKCKPQTNYSCFIVLLANENSYQPIVDESLALREFSRMPLKQQNKLYLSGKNPQNPINDNRFKKVYLADARIYYEDFTMTYVTQIRSPDIKR